MVQTDLVWENPLANKVKVTSILERVPRQTDLVLFPEAFLSGFSMNGAHLNDFVLSWSEAKDMMLEWSARFGFYIGASVFVRENGKNFNRFVVSGPGGEIIGFYDKRHLFTHAGEHRIFSPGNERTVIRLKGWNLMLQVCYDLRFPVWARNRYFREDAVYEYDVLVYVANWPAVRRRAYMRLLPSRAIENQSYVLWVNRTGKDGNGMEYAGDSRVISPEGESLASLGDDRDGCLDFVLDPGPLYQVRARMPLGPDWDDFEVKNSL